MSSNGEPLGDRRPILAAACWGGLFLIYEGLAASPTWPETIAGVLASAIATAAVLASGSADHLGRTSWRWWFLLLRRLPLRILVNALRVVAAAAGGKVRSGSMVAVPFEPGGDDAISASRRALVIAGGSLAPNSFVVGYEREPATLLVHRLVPGPASSGEDDRLWPV